MVGQKPNFQFYPKRMGVLQLLLAMAVYVQADAGPFITARFSTGSNTNMTAQYQINYAEFGPLPGGDAPIELVLAPEPSNLEVCAPIDPQYFPNISGKVLLVYRGSCAFVKKTIHGVQAGAVAVILIDRSTWSGYYFTLLAYIPSDLEDPLVPTLIVDLDAGTELEKALQGGKDRDGIEVIKVTVQLPGSSVPTNAGDWAALTTMASEVRMDFDVSEVTTRPWTDLTDPAKAHLDPCLDRLHGIFCTDGRVTHIHFIAVWDGPVPAAIGKLGALKYITIYKMKITGSLPCELNNLTDLVGLTLRDIAGGFGMCIVEGKLQKLKYLDFAGSHITSVAGFRFLTSLEYLELTGSNIEGDFPDLQGLSRLRVLILEQNSFTGKPLISNDAPIEVLYLSGNKMSGDIEHTFDGMASQERLDLSTIPTT